MLQREFFEPVHLAGLARTLARHWTQAPLAFVRNFHNVVYRIEGEPALYLRITPEVHRSRAQLESELEVVQHVGTCGIAANQPVTSRKGRLVHSASLGSDLYSACAFTEAQGLPVEGAWPADAERFFRDVGRTMARLHVALSTFRAPPGFQRFPWVEDRWARFAQHVPPSETEAWALFTELQRWTTQLPRDGASFGLIHGDFTIANLRYGGSTVALFDFDACCEHWRAYEMAVFLHYYAARDSERRRLAYDCFLDGYTAVCAVTPALLAQIPSFGKMRLLYSFLVFAEEWGFDDLDPDQHAYFETRRRLFREAPSWPPPAA